MAKFPKDTWRGKIDPAFDELIKDYLFFLKDVRLPANSGYIYLNEKGMKMLNEKTSKKIQSTYDPKLLMQKKTIKTLIKTGMSAEVDDIYNFLKSLGQKKRMKLKEFVRKMSALLKLIDNLPNEVSKAYYQKSFAPFRSWKDFKIYFRGKSIVEVNTWFERFLSDYGALLFRVGMKGYNLPVQNTKIKKDEAAKIIQGIIPFLHELICLNTHKMTLRELIKKANSGADEALFDVIQIDKTLIYKDWIQKKMHNAQYSGDKTFFKKLGEAISKEPLSNDVEYGELLIILKFFWPMGLVRLTKPELMSLLESCGLRLQDDPGSFRKFIDRHIKNGFLQANIAAT